MGAKKPSKRALLSEYLAQTQPSRIGLAEWQAIAQRLVPVSEHYLRDLLRGCGIPLDPVVEGVRQESIEELERTLLALAEQYLAGLHDGDRLRAELSRRAVIIGKDHARLSVSRAGTPREKRELKDEMISWMLVWLENPEAFPTWSRLRKRATSPRE